MKKTIPMILACLFLLVLPFAAQASEGIPLQKDILLGAPISGPEDLPEEVTFTLYDSQEATEPIGSQTFARGQYTVDFEFSKSDGITSGNVARVKANFTNKLNINDDPASAAKTKEIWLGIEVAGNEVSGRTKVSDDILVQLLLASDASIASYLTLVYEGDDNPIATIYRDLPLSSLSSDGSSVSMTEYFRTIANTNTETVISPDNLIDPNNWYASGSNIRYTNGKVAIGKTSPSFKLDVNAGTANVVGMFASTDATAFLYLKDNLTTANSTVRLGAHRDDLELWAGGVDRVHITGNGKVGINDTSPEFTLHTNSGNANVVAMFESTDADAFVYLKDGDTTDRTKVRIGADRDDLELWAGGSDRVHIRSNGNVGINTTGATYELSVNGTIRCKELIVDTGWSDFVFEEGYRLPPLSEVERHIQEKGHLPGVPTEAQVKEKGVSVGEISSRLLQKIEELTLYVIDLKKENDALKGQMAAIQKQLQGDKD